MFHVGVKQTQRAKAGIAMFVSVKFRIQIHSDTFVNKRLKFMCYRVAREHLTIVGICSPDKGGSEDSEAFYHSSSRAF